MTSGRIPHVIGALAIAMGWVGGCEKGSAEGDTVECGAAGSCPEGTRQLSATEYQARSTSQFYVTSGSCETLCEAIQPCLAPNVPVVTASSYTCAPLKGFAPFTPDDEVDLNFGSADGGPPPGPLTQVASLSVTGTPTLLASGDFDGDGDDDLVATDKTFADVALFTNHGDGTFDAEARLGALPNYQSSQRTRAIAVGQLDADALDDLAVFALDQSPSVYTATVFLFSGQAAGGFAPATSLPITLVDVALYISGISDVRAGDFDGDGKVDLVIGVTTTDGVCCASPALVNVYWGAGDGTFDPAPAAVPFGGVCGGGPCDDGPVSVVAADFTGDGIADLVLASDQHNHSALVRGASSRSFSSPALLPDNPYGVASMLSGDVDGDGDVDVATGGDQNSVALNQGDGTFAEWVRSEGIGCSSFGAVLADLDDNGRADLAMSCQFDQKLKLAESGGSATLLASPQYQLSGAPGALTAGALAPGGVWGLAVAVGSSIEVVKR